MCVPACCFTTCFQAHSIGSKLCRSMGTGIDGDIIVYFRTAQFAKMYHRAQSTNRWSS
ncbi:hypothetical protein BDY19DRAFT_976165 [Irpex rosettiformis]|uniref:Uncharacterized protein n=1 Tax=Irpex rosettiformis TaxID=378272 RepID=A0ACB8TNZ2_9APHY|nr:hypothetical protein BDY19DRAFT_976165 [Irpex rosettiformis]